MKYKVGDKINFVLNGFLTAGEVLEVKNSLFKRYRVTYKTINIGSYRSPVIWIKAKDIIGLDIGKDIEGKLKVTPPNAPGRQK